MTSKSEDIKIVLAEIEASHARIRELESDFGWDSQEVKTEIEKRDALYKRFQSTLQ